MLRIVVPVLLMMLPAFQPTRALAEPFTPRDEGEVLEQLPPSSNAELRELGELRRQLAATPNDRALAVDLAARYYTVGRRDTDPRFFGYAEAVLQPWWQDAEAAPDVLLLRAGIRQARHDFDGALADLELLLRKDPRNAEAWLMRGVIQMVKGQLKPALDSCKPLLLLHKLPAGLSCAGSIAAVNGNTDRAEQLLSRALQMTPETDTDVRVRLMALLGKVYQRLGKHEPAEGSFKSALTLLPRDGFTLSAYADFLLDTKRPKEVIPLLRDQTRIDGLLLRLALAERATGTETWQTHAADLAARFDASRLRGDSLHLADESRYYLSLADNPRRALELALTNFQTQKEYWDIRVLLEAAVGAKEPGAAKAALDFLAETHLNDPIVNALVNKLAPRTAP